MARPAKLTKEAQQRIAKAMSVGVTVEVAAQYAGVSRSTLYNWLQRGKKAKSGKFHEFLDAIEKARAEFEVAAAARIHKAGEQSWQAYAWMLERTRPDRWGRKQQTDVTVHAPLEEVATEGQRLEALEAILKRRREEEAATEQAVTGEGPADQTDLETDESLGEGGEE